MLEKLAIKPFQSMEKHTISYVSVRKLQQTRIYSIQGQLLLFPYLFYNLKVLEGTGACGTARPRKGVPIEFVKAKFKQLGKYKCMTYNDVIVSMRILDRKHVTLLSTVYRCKEIDSGRKHWKTKEAVTKQEITCGADSNDQLMQYSVFSRQTVKWWKKVSFCLLNLVMVNSFILYCK